MENSGNEQPDGNKKEYRPRLSPEGKAFLKMQHLIIMIWKDYNDTRAEKKGGDFLLCSDNLCDLSEWVDKDLLMMTYKGHIINFAFIVNVLPDGEKLKLEMAEGMSAIVTKSRKREFKCRYERYKRNNKLRGRIAI
jgi:hypothetical protein